MLYGALGQHVWLLHLTSSLTNTLKLEYSEKNQVYILSVAFSQVDRELKLPYRDLWQFFLCRISELRYILVCSLFRLYAYST